jgi:hypothetical protein
MASHVATAVVAPPIVEIVMAALVTTEVEIEVAVRGRVTPRAVITDLKVVTKDTTIVSLQVEACVVDPHVEA